MKRRTTVRRKKKSTQKGGLFPLAALIPLAIAGAKAAGLGALGGAAGYGAKRAIQAIEGR